jgi:hypothetical protein
MSMHQNLYPEFLLAIAIFVMAFCVFISMLIAAIVSLIREHGAKVKPVPAASRRFSSIVERIQHFLRKERARVIRYLDIS